MSINFENNLHISHLLNHDIEKTTAKLSELQKKKNQIDKQIFEEADKDENLLLFESNNPDIQEYWSTMREKMYSEAKEEVKEDEGKLMRFMQLLKNEIDSESNKSELEKITQFYETKVNKFADDLMEIFCDK